MKLCILAAGAGTRLDTPVPKPLAPVENIPLIEYCRRQFPDILELVVVVGHKADLMESFLEEYYSAFDLELVETDIDILGAGPGASLLDAREALDGSDFICIPADSFYDGAVYLELDTALSVFLDIPEQATSYGKVDDNEDLVFSGIFSVARNTAPRFFAELKKEKAAAIKQCRETLIAPVIKELVRLEVLESKETDSIVSWYDCGTNEKYNAFNYGSSLSIPKEDQVIFKPGPYSNKYIKYIADEEVVDKLYRRSQEKFLNKIIPEHKLVGPNLLAVEDAGKTIEKYYNQNSTDMFDVLSGLWTSQSNQVLSGSRQDFENNCKLMYEDKTRQRTEKLQDYFEEDLVKHINGVPQLPIKTIVDSIDWAHTLRYAHPGGFHGDFQPGNILVNKAGQIKLIDHRHSFGSSETIGDMYYDLGKFLHALVFKSSTAQHTRIEKTSDGGLLLSVTGSTYSPGLLYNQFVDFVLVNNFSFTHVTFVSYLHYLSIAELYLKTNRKAALATFLVGKLGIMDFLLSCDSYVKEECRGLFTRIQ